MEQCSLSATLDYYIHMKKRPTTTQHSSITSSPKPKKKNVREVPSRFLQPSQKPTHRPPPAKDPPAALNHSFESAESASLNSTRPPLKPATRTPRASEVRPLKSELRDMELLQSQLLQWSFANALAESSSRVLTAKAEDDLFDRGQQLIELKKQANALGADLLARRQTRLLDEVLTLEYSSLKPVESHLVDLADPLKELEKAVYYSLHRLKLGEKVAVEPLELLEGLRRSKTSLQEIVAKVKPESEEVMQLTERMKCLAELVGVEREEVARGAELLEELRKLCGEERGELAAGAQAARDREIEEMLTERLL